MRSIRLSCQRFHPIGIHRWFGRYSRMLDLGGAPISSSQPTKKLNLNKNCHLQFVIFDFEVLCRSLEKKDSTSGAPVMEKLTTKDSVVPDIDRVNQVAQLLKVNLGSKNDRDAGETEDDLSLLTGEKPKEKVQPKKSTATVLGSDLRQKYAEKLKQKAGVGVQTVDLVKEELAKGDAGVHFSARNQALGTSSSKWMAGTGTGQLLSFLHNRNLKVILLPTPVTIVSDKASPSHLAETQSMKELVQQLQNKLSFHSVIHQDGSWTAERMFETGLKDTVGLRDRCLCVSDRDTILRTAKDAGMITLRVRAHANAPRGNVSTNYTVESVTETQAIVNEINGISFNTVLQGFG